MFFDEGRFGGIDLWQSDDHELLTRTRHELLVYVVIYCYQRKGSVTGSTCRQRQAFRGTNSSRTEQFCTRFRTLPTTSLKVAL